MCKLYSCFSLNNLESQYTILCIWWSVLSSATLQHWLSALSKWEQCGVCRSSDVDNGLYISYVVYLFLVFTRKDDWRWMTGIHVPDGCGHFSLWNISDFVVQWTSEKFLAVQCGCIYVWEHEGLNIIDSLKECYKNLL